MLIWIVLVSVVLFFLWVRFAPTDTAKWHINPESVEKNKNPNQFLVRDGADMDSPVFEIPASVLAQEFDSFALGRPRVSLVAGAVDDLFVTYEQRSKILAYPDYVSVKVIDLGAEESKLVIYSRSRYGRSDLGVNHARIKSWLSGLITQISGRQTS